MMVFTPTPTLTHTHTHTHTQTHTHTHTTPHSRARVHGTHARVRIHTGMHVRTLMPKTRSAFLLILGQYKNRKLTLYIHRPALQTGPRHSTYRLSWCARRFDNEFCFWPWYYCLQHWKLRCLNLILSCANQDLFGREHAKVRWSLQTTSRVVLWCLVLAI